MKFFLIFCTLVALNVCVLNAQGLTPLADESRVHAVVERLSGVLVRVKASVELPAELVGKEPKEAKEDKKSEEPKTALRLGTGFFVSTDGYLVTNASIVHQAKRIWYEYDGVPYLAELVGYDITTNVALLKAKTKPANFVSVNLSDTVALPLTGSLLVRLSLPMEFGATPALGLVQGAESQFGAKAFPTRYLRVQLGTGPGEAGAPVFDLQGRFVGMSVATLPEVGSTYVLPARAIAWVRDGMMSNKGEIQYAAFGFNADESRSAVDGTTLIVRTVEDKSVAAQAGLKEGDQIIEAARRPCTALSDLRDAAFYTRPGQYLDLKIKRGKNTEAISIQAAAR